MREAAERRTEPAAGPKPGAPLGLTPLQRLVAPGDHERIVRIFGAEAAPEAAPGSVPAASFEAETDVADASDPEADLDWPSAIQLIREAGERVREVRASAQEATRRAHALVGRSAQQAEAAEQRARAAEDVAAAAQRRAEQAEAALAAAEARMRRAEEEAAAARAAEAEVRLWLRRLVACLKTEFAELTEGTDAARA